MPAGVNARKELPLPPFPSKDARAVVSHSPKGISTDHPILYEKGMSAFTLVLSRKAIQDILKILVQFVDPADLAGIVDIEVRGGKAHSVSKRFIEPAITSD